MGWSCDIIKRRRNKVGDHKMNNKKRWQLATFFISIKNVNKIRYKLLLNYRKSFELNRPQCDASLKNAPTSHH